jgi:phospholipase A2
VHNKVKGFWKNVIVPTTKGAMADVSSIKQAMSVEAMVKQDLKDPKRFPEVAHTAEVRRGLDLSHEEKEYLHARKMHVRDHFAKYIGLDPAQVHPDDVPTIGLGGSGGGYRAMLGLLGYAQEMKEGGLWDLLTYVAGVSGSCWSLAAYYTFGEADILRVIDHCKKRMSPHHPLSPEAVRSVLNSPGGHYKTLGPLVAKSQSGLKTVAMDLYSTFTTGYLFMPQDPLLAPGGPVKAIDVNADPHRNWYKWSHAIKHLMNGQEPMPILTAIRHERPWKDWVDQEHPFRELNPGEHEHSDAADAWFQWFEISPFEIGCDELEAFVPTWGFGRPFAEGKSTIQLPEQSLALLLGLCVSAPAGPLTSYIATIQRNLPQGFIGNAIHDMASTVTKFWGKQGTEEFRQHHPLHACNEHNFMFHLSPAEAGQKRPAGIENSPRIHLIDSGMDNNCPTYVLLHPDRKVDIILNMDASSDVQKDSFQSRVDQIGSRRGLKFTRRHDIEANNLDQFHPDRFKGMYAQIFDGVLIPRPQEVVDSYGQTVNNPPAPVCRHECTMVYLPLLPNERAVPGFDPSTAKFSGSYNLVWTEAQIEVLIKVCQQNFRDGEDTIKLVLKEAYEKKKRTRESGIPLA